MFIVIATVLFFKFWRWTRYKVHLFISFSLVAACKLILHIHVYWEQPCLMKSYLPLDMKTRQINTLETKDLHYSLMKKIMMTDSFSCLSDWKGWLGGTNWCPCWIRSRVLNVFCGVEVISVDYSVLSNL